MDGTEVSAYAQEALEWLGGLLGATANFTLEESAVLHRAYTVLDAWVIED